MENDGKIEKGANVVMWIITIVVVCGFLTAVKSCTTKQFKDGAAREREYQRIRDQEE